MPKARTAEEAVQAIIDAAQALFAQRGYAAVAVSEVAGAAGVSQGLIYHHFDSKHALWTAVFERASQKFLTFAAAGDVQQNSDPWAYLAYILRVSMIFALQNPDLTRLRAWDRLHALDVGSAMLAERIEVVERAIATLQEKGLVRANKVARFYASSIHIWMSGWTNHMVHPHDCAYNEDSVDLFVEGMIKTLQIMA